ncbi:hypothetical protein LINPERPRIM_LOCUS2910, partial [Linum perenne]
DEDRASLNHRDGKFRTNETSTTQKVQFQAKINQICSCSCLTRDEIITDEQARPRHSAGLFPAQGPQNYRAPKYGPFNFIYIYVNYFQPTKNRNGKKTLHLSWKQPPLLSWEIAGVGNRRRALLCLGEK